MNDKLKQLYRQYSESGRSALSPEAKSRVKDKVFQRLSEPATEVQLQPVSFWEKLRGSFMVRSYVIVPLALILIIISSTAASATSLPGDLLYPLKRQVESARIWLAPTPAARMDLEVDFAEQRLQELKNLQNDEFPMHPLQSGNSNAGVSANSAANANISNSNAKTNDDAINAAKKKRKEQAKKEANDALEFLKKAQSQYQKDRQNQKADNLNKVIDDLKNSIKRDDDGNQPPSSVNGVPPVNLNVNANIQGSIPPVHVSLPHGL
jgi:CRISPR/Cas system CSM-associated protein Csm2 small subunit